MPDIVHTLESYDVFISYSSKDLEFAVKLHSKLEEAGFAVWFDKARLNSGCKWHTEIEAGCQASRVLLPVLTKNWKQSAWTRYETYGAEAILPVHVSGAIEEVVTPPLSRVQTTLKIDPLTARSTDWETLFADLRRLLAKPRIEKGERTAHLRYRPNPNFVGREQDLLNIHEILYRTPTSTLTQGQSIAVNAMGGIGKTTLAREYAEHYWRLFEQILWVDSRAGFISEFAKLAEIFDPDLKEVTDATEKAAIALKVLNEQTERLLILDNVEDEESVQQWIPKSGGCHTIITSRFASWSDAIQTLHVYVLDKEPARELLLKRAGRDATEENIKAADALANALGYLPLALVQAAAFIKEEGADYSFDDYLLLYKQSTNELLAEGVLGSTEYPDSVITTWRATMDRFEDNTIARSILRLCSFYSNEPIPQALIEDNIQWVQTASNRLMPFWKRTIGGFGRIIRFSKTKSESTNELLIRNALGSLASYSMIERHGHAFTIHALVQTVQRLEISAKEQKPWLKTALHIINEFATGDPTDVRTWNIWKPIDPHVAAVVQHAGKINITDRTTRMMSVWLMVKYGHFQSTKGQFKVAEHLFRRALTIDKDTYGAVHPFVARDLNNLARLLIVANRLDEAVLLCEKALAIDISLNGENHPNVASDLDSLAQLLKATNRLDDAEPLMRRALVINLSSFGADHPKVATSLNNLAQLLKATNRLEEAEPMMRRALAISISSFGVDHPKVASALNNLVQLLQATNRPDEVESLMQRVLVIYETSFGLDHPKVGIALNNLAQFIQQQDQLEEAEQLMRRVLAIDEKFYSSNHPIVARDLGNLGDILRVKGDLEEAETLLMRAVKIDKETLVKDHPDLARDSYKLAMLEHSKDNKSEAQRLLQDSLTVFRSNFDDDTHPRIQETLRRMKEIGMEPPERN